MRYRQKESEGPPLAGLLVFYACVASAPATLACPHCNGDLPGRSSPRGNVAQICAVLLWLSALRAEPELASYGSLGPHRYQSSIASPDMECLQHCDAVVEPDAKPVWERRASDDHKH